MNRFLLIACLASAVICVSGGSPGMPGLPGGSGGLGGSGGNGGGSPGLPGDDDEYDYDYDDALTYEDYRSIFSRAGSGGLGGSGGSPGRPGRPGGSSSKPRVRLGPECRKVEGVKEFVSSRTNKKDNWLTFLIKLVADGKSACAKELSDQLLRDA